MKMMLSRTAPKLPSFEASSRAILESWHTIVEHKEIEPPFAQAFERHYLRPAIKSRSKHSIRDDAFYGTAKRSLIDEACLRSQADFRKSTIQLKGAQHWCKLPRQAAAQKAIENWARLRAKKVGDGIAYCSGRLFP